ncbi:centrosomal protein of 41 kDa-like [Boleophthalmus pectinirostris]|uniref:centrosomal protein of 41 kDa-like n=1 Tax=Boleophthalmus pectinirostris TaxID=150288 RepID=UPI002431EA6F|nr:centrosomal protein of 41 kDa-like [Boleophthalmus pectinirostris]
MSLKQGIGNAEYFNKRVPKNAKYQNIKSKLDTGCSLSKYMEKIEDMKRNYRYSKDEIFKRFKVTTFVQLIIQVASVSKLTSSLSECELNTPEDALSVASEELESLTVRSYDSNSSPSTERGDAHTARSTLLSVISGELSTEQSPDPESNSDSDKPYKDCPYLLLDVRDRDQYDSCHIISAHSFPIAFLSRTMNPYTKEVLEYKNAPGKIIIVYDEDETIASQAASIMCQRGFENLSMLSGGLKVLSQKFPGSLVSGPLPPLCFTRSASVKGRRVAPPSGHTRAEQRWRFTADELNRLTDQLEEALVPSNNSSRMSSRISSVSSQSARSRHSSSSCSSRPWK